MLQLRRRPFPMLRPGHLGPLLRKNHILRPLLHDPKRPPADPGPNHSQKMHRRRHPGQHVPDRLHSRLHLQSNQPLRPSPNPGPANTIPGHSRPGHVLRIIPIHDLQPGRLRIRRNPHRHIRQPEAPLPLRPNRLRSTLRHHRNPNRPAPRNRHPNHRLLHGPANRILQPHLLRTIPHRRKQKPFFHLT